MEIIIINSNHEKFFLKVHYLKYLKTLNNMLIDLNKSSIIKIYLSDIDINIMKIIGILLFFYLIFLDKFCFLLELLKNDFNYQRDGIEFLKKYNDNFEKILLLSDYLDFEELYISCKEYFKYLIKILDEKSLIKFFNFEKLECNEKKEYVNMIGSYLFNIKM